MSWRDRDYYRGRPSTFEGGAVGLGFPKPTRMVLYLIIANFAVFLLGGVGYKDRLEDLFALIGLQRTGAWLEVWRLVTYQFLHGGPKHIIWNMLGLYFFGPPLEKCWGSNRFLLFYLLCGVVGGLTFLAVSTTTPRMAILIGASGSVLGLIAACAALFPHMIIILLFFPVPIRFAAVLIASFSVLYFIWDKDLAEACHLGGMVGGLLLAKAGPLWQGFTHDRRRMKRQALLDEEATDQKRVDEILDKVHQQGIQSLTWGEKRALRDITRRQKQRDELRKRRG